MTNPVPARVPLGASTTARMWYVDIDTTDPATPDTPVWTPINGITEFQPSQDDNLEDDSDYDSEGFQSQSKTAEAWSLAITVRRGVTRAAPTAYDPGQEFLRSKAQAKMGPANTVHVRWYEMTEDGPRKEAYEGFGAAGWAPAGGAMTALNTVACTVTGQGKRESITHPDGV